MRKFFLLSLALLASIGLWADDPTVNAELEGSTKADYFKLYEGTGLTLSTDQAMSSGAVQINSALDASTTPAYYYGFSSVDDAIDSIAILFSGNGSNKSLNPALLGYTSASGYTVSSPDTVIFAEAQTSTANSKAAAKWFKFDLSSSNIKGAMIVKQFKKVTYDKGGVKCESKNSYPSSTQTLKCYHIKVWLKPAAPTISTPTTDQSATYTVGDAITALSITATGKPTPTYQWYYNSSASTEGATSLGSGAQTASYTPANDVASDLYYYCVASNSGGSATSPYFHVTINNPSTSTHAISYTNLKGSDVSAYPTEYYEGYGIASFDALADVTDFHFTGWSPASIGKDATADPFVIEAQWVAAYNVTFDAGAGGGTVPATFQKWAGAKFNLPGQGSMTAPDGKAFNGWKANGTGAILAANSEYTMTADAVEFVAQWTATPTTIFSMEASSSETFNKVAASTTLALTTANELASISGGTAEYKNNNTDARAVRSKQGEVVYFMIEKTGSYFAPTLTSGTFQEGDTIKASVFGGKDNRGIYFTTSATDNVANSYNVQTGSGAGSNSEIKNLYYVIGENDDLIGHPTIYVQRYTGNSTYFRTFRIIRPAIKTYKITKSVNDASMGSVSTSALTLDATETATLTATPKAGYQFVSWAVSGEGATLSSTTSNPTTLTMGTANVTVTATFEARPSHQITYTNTKGAANSNPSTYREGIGVASFTKLRHVVGYDFTGWNPSSISAEATTDQTIEAQWSERAIATGADSLKYAFAFSSGKITTSSITRGTGTLSDATDVSVEHTSFKDNATANGCSGKLATTANKDDNNYVELTFKIADGYTFTPTEVKVRGNAVTNKKALEVELKDNAATPNSKSVKDSIAAGTTSGGSTVTLDFDKTGEVALRGTVTAKIFVYGDENHWRLGTSLMISGTVAAIDYKVNFAAGEGEGSMDAVIHHVGDEVTLPECTFTAPANKEFAAWTSSDVTIENGKFTMPASDVTVTATWTPGTALDNTDVNAKAVKRLENGILVIVKNGRLFNAQGQLVK